MSGYLLTYQSLKSWAERLRLPCRYNDELSQLAVLTRVGNTDVPLVIIPRPERGMVKVRSETRNQQDEPVQLFTMQLVVARRRAHDPDRTALETSERGDHALSEITTELENGIDIENTLDDGTHAIGAAPPLRPAGVRTARLRAGAASPEPRGRAAAAPA